MKNLKTKMYGVLGVVVILFILGCIEKIPAGYVGVVYSPSSGIEKDVLPQGWHMVNPFKKVTEYTTAIEQVYMSADSREGSKGDDSVGVSTADGKVVKVSLEYSYRFDAETVTTLYTRFRGRTGEEIAEIYMRGKIRTFVSEVTSKYTMIDLYGAQRSNINVEILKYVREQFLKESIVIESINIIEVLPDEETKRAIQARINSSQLKEKEIIETEIARQVALKNEVSEQGKVTVTKLKADAEAYEIKARAEAEAYALKVKQAQLTQQLIEYEKAIRTKGFDGIDNLTIMGDGAGVLKTIK